MAAVVLGSKTTNAARFDPLRSGRDAQVVSVTVTTSGDTYDFPGKPATQAAWIANDTDDPIAVTLNAAGTQATFTGTAGAEGQLIFWT